MPKEKTHKKKKKHKTVKALLKDSDRQVLRFNRLTPLPGLFVSHKPRKKQLNY